MVRGLQQFRNHFSDYTDRYVLIGGAACSVVMEEVGVEFRATKDLDIVLYVETLDEDFVSAFWDFIKIGGYRNQQRSTGKDVFYRFYSPDNNDFPMMLELFSRVPNSIKLADGSHLTPIPTNKANESLSAILLNDDYYHFTQSGRQEVDGLSVLKSGYLIPLKARAWIDLMSSKQLGMKVDEKNIRKHKNDVLRLYQLLTPATRILMPATIKQDMKKFLNDVENEIPVDMRSVGLKQGSFNEMVHNLKQIYGL